MPKYKNISNKIVNTLSGNINPGDILITDVLLEINPNIKKIEDDPIYNPTIVSGRFTKDGDLLIPFKDGYDNIVTMYQIHMHCTGGYAEIYFNNKNNNPPIYLYPDGTWNIRLYERKIDKILFQLKNSTLTINIEKIGNKK